MSSIYIPSNFLSGRSDNKKSSINLPSNFIKYNAGNEKTLFEDKLREKSLEKHVLSTKGSSNIFSIRQYKKPITIDSEILDEGSEFLIDSIYYQTELKNNVFLNTIY